MALITDFTCRECNESVFEVVTSDRVCGNCRTQKADKARRLHFAGLKGLTLEERIEKIEQQLYDSDVNRRLSCLESKLATY